MAELLIKAVDAFHPDPEKDQRGSYKQGDIVLVMEDGHEWGAKEILPPQQGGKFVRVQITGVTVAQVMNWCQNNWGMLLDASERIGGVDVTRRAIRIDVSLLPNNVRNTLNRDGFYANTWSNIRDYVRNKITDSTAAGSDL